MSRCRFPVNPRRDHAAPEAVNRAALLDARLARMDPDACAFCSRTRVSRQTLIGRLHHAVGASGCKQMDSPAVSRGGARLFMERRAVFSSYRLSGADFSMVNVVPVPGRLEQRIAENGKRGCSARFLCQDRRQSGALLSSSNTPCATSLSTFADSRSRPKGFSRTIRVRPDVATVPGHHCSQPYSIDRSRY